MDNSETNWLYRNRVNLLLVATATLLSVVFHWYEMTHEETVIKLFLVECLVVLAAVVTLPLGTTLLSIWSPSHSHNILKFLFVLLIVEGITWGFFLDLHRGPYLLAKGSKVEGFLGEGESVVAFEGHGVHGYTPVKPNQVAVCRVKVGDTLVVVQVHMEAALTRENYPKYLEAIPLKTNLQSLCDSSTDFFPQKEIVEILRRHVDFRTYVTRDWEIQQAVAAQVIPWLAEKTKGTVTFSGVSVPR